MFKHHIGHRQGGRKRQAEGHREPAGLAEQGGRVHIPSRRNPFPVQPATSCGLLVRDDPLIVETGGHPALGFRVRAVDDAHPVNGPGLAQFTNPAAAKVAQPPVPSSLMNTMNTAPATSEQSRTVPITDTSTRSNRSVCSSNHMILMSFR